MKTTKEQRDAFRSGRSPILDGQNQYIPIRQETFVTALLDDLDEAIARAERAERIKNTAEDALMQSKTVEDALRAEVAKWIDRHAAVVAEVARKDAALQKAVEALEYYRDQGGMSGRAVTALLHISTALAPPPQQPSPPQPSPPPAGSAAQEPDYEKVNARMLAEAIRDDAEAPAPAARPEPSEEHKHDDPSVTCNACVQMMAEMEAAPAAHPEPSAEQDDAWRDAKAFADGPCRSGKERIEDLGCVQDLAAMLRARDAATREESAQRIAADGHYSVEWLREALRREPPSGGGK